MPGVTGRLDLPYPAGTDPLGDGADTIRDAMLLLDDLGQLAVSGEVTVTVAAANTDYSQAVSFPTWFTDMADALGVTIIGLAFNPIITTLGNVPEIVGSGISTSGFTLRWRRANTTGFTLTWTAVARVV